MATASSTPDPHEILDNISLLYELSLGIGTSLDLHENCEFFIQKLMSRQNLSFVAIYSDTSLQEQVHRQTDPNHRYCCLHTCPQLSSQELKQIVSTELLLQMQSQDMLCINSRDSAEATLPSGVFESFPGIFSAFSVCQGKIIIILINQMRDSAYPDWEIKQLHLLLDKFGRSVQACLNHESLRQATQAKLTLEKQLGQAQRLESLGLMAGGIAHDLGNILNPLAAYPDLLSRSFSEGTKEQFMLSQMQGAVDKASAMMKDLLALTRKVESCHAAMPLALPIHQYLTSATFLALQSSEPNISCQWQLDTESRIQADNTMITRVILNLVTNAFDALNGQGNVEIQVYDHDLFEPYEGYCTIPANPYVVLSVRDNGKGIPQEALAHIFEPFFSKKKLGRSGSGLGLAVVYNIVQGLNGFIDVQTSAEGTSFIMYFPRWETEAVISASKSPQSTPETVTSAASAARPFVGKEAKDNVELTPPASRKSAQDIIHDDITFMSKEWLHEFESALSSLNTQLIKAQVETIPVEHQRLKEAIASLAQKYRYDILLEIIQVQD